MVAALVGVWLGEGLQGRRERTRRIREACETLIATAIEAAGAVEANETWRGGGEQPLPIRADIGRDMTRARAILSFDSAVLTGHAHALAQVLTHAVTTQGRSNDAAERKTARDALQSAIASFGNEAQAETRRHWWQRLWRRLRKG